MYVQAISFNLFFVFHIILNRNWFYNFYNYSTLSMRLWILVEFTPLWYIPCRNLEIWPRPVLKHTVRSGPDYRPIGSLVVWSGLSRAVYITSLIWDSRSGPDWGHNNNFYGKDDYILQKLSEQNFSFKGYDFLGAPDVTGPQTTYMASLAVVTPLSFKKCNYY